MINSNITDAKLDMIENHVNKLESPASFSVEVTSSQDLNQVVKVVAIWEVPLDEITELDKEIKYTVRTYING